MSSRREQSTYTVREEDLPYEEEVQSNRYSLRAWLRYLEFKSHAKQHTRNLLHERALRELPRSYKLWHQYLTERTKYTRTRRPDHPQWELTNQVFERSIVTMSKMPRIWLNYCEFMVEQKLITRTRHVFDRALQSLPVTQHKRIWDVYIPWTKSIPGGEETSVRIYRRCLKLDRNAIVEEFIEFLLGQNRQLEAIEHLSAIVNDAEFHSKQGKSKHQLWLQLCDILSKHPECGRKLNVEAIIRQGLENFTDQVGRLWTALANYYIRQSNFEKARDVFEEALSSVMALRDFVHIWEAYTQFEDSLISAHLLEKERELQEESSTELTEEDQFEFELRVARYEYLIDRRPLLLSSVKLRQNPHNVEEWHHRVQLYQNPASIIETYTLALRTVDPFQATGKPHTLWVKFARFYASHHDLESARSVFERAVTSPFRSIDHLASIWCAYVEMELVHRNFSQARSLIRRATEPPAKPHAVAKNANLPVQDRVFKSTRLWKLHVDLEESLGSFESTRQCYERILDLRVATPELVIQYARFLEERKYFEEAFKAYERGVQLFPFPFSLDIWVSYLNRFVARYAGTKMERTRDLFEQALEKVPSDLAKLIYVLYAEVEEEYGYARHAMNIYDRATRAVSDSDKFELYQLYIGRATEFFGVTRTREIYEKGISSLPEASVPKICLQYADLEAKLGEIDRARAIYVHASQFSDPRSNLEFWRLWREFEVRHGNVDTFREMLRIRRSVQAQYNTQVNFIAAQFSAASSSTNASEKAFAKIPHQELGKRPRDDQEEAESQISVHQHLVPTTSAPIQALAQPQQVVSAAANEEEIDLDGDMDDEAEEPDLAVEERAVPAAVFGSAKPDEYQSRGAAKPMGALERLKARK